MARRKIVAGNWKMNMTPSQAVALCAELKDLVKSDTVDVVYCVPAIDIVPVVEAVKDTNVAVGAENMYFEEKGAYTGEISAAMLVDAGVKYVIIGHSERRDYFKETDELLNKKVKKAFEAGLTPILCCGETLEQRETGVTMDWIRLQIKSDLVGITADQVKNMVIAYEPIWAIGTGKTATTEQAQDYSEYNTGTDPSAGRTRLQTELLAGNIPDLLDNADLPMGQYARRGYLEDLLPWLEGDPDLGREAVMTQVIDAACRDGKLYQAFPSFTILTAAGRTGAVGDRVSWTWADLREAMEALPEDSTVFGACGRVELLDLLLPMTVDALVDREAGTVREEAVRSFLAFCAAAPLRTEWVEDIYTAALNGELLLLPAELTRLDSCAEVQMYTTAFGGPCSYVGYPREDGGAGSFFRLWDGISMASGCKNKEAAWSFLREAFLPKYPTGIYFGPALPISRADFDRMAEISTGPMLDETGQPMETAGPACVMMPGSDLEIPIRPVTQEEYDHFMTLYNAVDQVYDPDEALTAIIREEALAFLDGSRTLDDTVRLIENRGKLYLQETQ